MTNLPTTLVCFAVKEEAIYFKRWAVAHPEIEILLTGMGRQNAEKTVEAALAHRRPRRLITAGFAGGLSPDLARGTVVYQADEATGLFEGLRAAGARPARIHCVSSVIQTAEQKQALRTSTGADAVDMESRFICDLCRKHNVPSATVRVILDTAKEDLVLDFNQIMTPDLRINPTKLAVHLIKSPAKIPALVRLQKQSSACARRLAEVLSQVATSSTLSV